MDGDRRPKTGIRQIGGCAGTGAWLGSLGTLAELTVSPGNVLLLNYQQARALASDLLAWAGEGDKR
jgi:hypothetical protein